MKAQDVVNQLAVALPKYSDKFTDNVSVTSLTRSGTTVTATTATAHGLAAGEQANIVGAKTPIVISSLTRSGAIGTLVTGTNHDLTENFTANIELSGATEAEFNGTFAILEVKNRKTITFTMPDSGAVTATGSPLLLNGSSALQSYNGLKEITAVPSTTTFQYEVSDATIYTPASGTIVARSKPRISAAITEEVLLASYTKQPQNEFWAFVILGDVDASKSRNIQSDAVDNLQRGNEYRQQLIQPFTVYVFMPSKTEISGRNARDTAEDLFRPICQSLLGAKFDSGLYVGSQNPVVFSGHGFSYYHSAFYVHAYSFQSVADITFDDTVGYDVDVAFRDVILNMTLDIGTEEDPVTANIDLDEVQL